MNKQRFSFYLMCVYFVAIFCVSASVIPYRSLFLNGILIILVIMCGIYNLFKGDASIYLFLLYIVAMFGDIYAGINIKGSLSLLVAMISYYFVLNAYFSTKDSFDQILRILMLTMFIGGPLIGTIQLATGRFLYPAVSDSTFIRTLMVNANQQNPNYSALTMMGSLFLGLYFYHQQNENRKIRYLVVTIWSVIALILTFSRGGMFASAVAIFLYVFMNILKKNRKISNKVKIRIVILWFCIITFLIIGGKQIINVVIDFIGSKDVQTLIRYKSTSTVSDRSQQWIAAVQAIGDGNIIQKLFGFGSSYATVLSSYSNANMSAHNIFFGALAQYGVLGACLIIAVYLSIGRRFYISLVRNKELPLIYCWTLSVLIAYQLISIHTNELVLSIVVFDVYSRMSKTERAMHISDIY